MVELSKEGLLSKGLHRQVINGPDIARAVLNIALSFINSLIDGLPKISLKHCHA